MKYLKPIAIVLLLVYLVGITIHCMKLEDKIERDAPLVYNYEHRICIGDLCLVSAGAVQIEGVAITIDSASTTVHLQDGSISAINEKGMITTILGGRFEQDTFHKRKIDPRSHIVFRSYPKVSDTITVNSILVEPN